MERKLIHFYCRHDKLDVTLVAIQRHLNRVVGMVWVALCPKCNRELIRLIENPEDPYYRISKKVKAQRRKYAHYFLQPGDKGFDEIYPHVKREREEKEEEAAREEWMKQHDYP